MADVKKKKYKTNINEKSLDNLKMATPINERDNFKELSSKGGKASVKRKKELRRAKDILNDILSTELSNDNIENILGDNADIIPDNTVYSVMLAKMASVANSGNVKAAEFIRDTAGDKPIDSSNVNIAATITDKDRQLLSLLSEKMQEKS